MKGNSIPLTSAARSGTCRLRPTSTGTAVAWTTNRLIVALGLFYALLLNSAAFAFVPMAITNSNVTPRRAAKSVALNKKPAGMSEEEYQAKMEKATKAMTAFTNKYLQNTDTTLCTDKSVPAVVIKGLAEHKVSLGTPLCPCRFYENKEAEAKDGFWNCPCVPMRERHECHCMLFLTQENAFAGKDQHISFDEVKDFSNKLK